MEHHYGQSTRVITNILNRDKQRLKRVFRDVCWSLQWDPFVDTLVFFCDHGKHRSVGVESLTANAMALCTTAWEIPYPVHLMRKYWSGKKCGWAKCAECDFHNEEKQAAFLVAAELFMEAWVQQSQWTTHL